MSLAMLTKDRSAWLRWRQGGIGASEIPVILGLSQRKNPTALGIYLAKIGEDPQEERDDAENEAMEIGIEAEPMLQRLYEKRTGRRIQRTQVALEHTSIPHIRATLDGITTEGRIVEFKTCGGDKAKELGEPGTDEVAADWIAQAQQQMIVADAEVVDFMVLVGGFALAAKLYTVKRDPRWEEAIVWHTKVFWDRVIRRDPPPAGPNDCRNLAKLLKPSMPRIEFDGDDCDLVERWESASALEKTSAADKKAIEVEIRQALGNAFAAGLADGRVLKRQVQEVAERTSTVKAHTRDYLQLVKGARS